MKKILSIVGSVLILFFMSSCDGSSSNPSAVEVGTGDGGNNQMNIEDARYTVTFDATWSVATHPTNFPSNPHFSGLIGATHSADLLIWELGGAASAGMEFMAETGSKALLTTEIQNHLNAGLAGSLLSGGGIGSSPSQVSLEFGISSGYPLVTLVSMLAPSPDWFVGVSGLSLLNSEGEWMDEVVVELFLYDAGTDNGVRFQSANSNTNPAEPIHRVVSAAVDTDFVEGKPPVGTFRFLRSQ